MSLCYATLITSSEKSLNTHKLTMARGDKALVFQIWLGATPLEEGQFKGSILAGSPGKTVSDCLTKKGVFRMTVNPLGSCFVELWPT